MCVSCSVFSPCWSMNLRSGDGYNESWMRADARALMLKMYVDTHICYVCIYIHHVMSLEWHVCVIAIDGYWRSCHPRLCVCLSVWACSKKKTNPKNSTFHLLVCKKGKGDAHKSVILRHSTWDWHAVILGFVCLFRFLHSFGLVKVFFAHWKHLSLILLCKSNWET